MQIVLNVSTETAQFLEAIRAKGIDVDILIEQTLREAASSITLSRNEKPGFFVEAEALQAEARRLQDNPQAWQALHQRQQEKYRKRSLPVLPEEAYSRESFYGERG